MGHGHCGISNYWLNDSKMSTLCLSATWRTFTCYVSCRATPVVLWFAETATIGSCMELSAGDRYADAPPSTRLQSTLECRRTSNGSVKPSARIPTRLPTKWQIPPHMNCLSSSCSNRVVLCISSASSKTCLAW